MDFTKMYDQVPVNKLWDVLKRSSVKATVIKAIQQLYQSSVSRITMGNELSIGFIGIKGLQPIPNSLQNLS